MNGWAIKIVGSGPNEFLGGKLCETQKEAQNFFKIWRGWYPEFVEKVEFVRAKMVEVDRSGKEVKP